MGNLYDKLYRQKRLLKAWKHVIANARASESDITLKDLEEFSKNSERNLKLINSELKKKKYIFSPARGVPLKRYGKAPRPIVVIPIRDRIVQRSILDVLQSLESVNKYVNVPTSFGGIEGRQVREAIEKVCISIKAGYKYYIRSNIKDFFTCIPRLNVIGKICELLPDNSLNKILDEATRTELANFAKLGTEAGLFPSYEKGVAQGFCLSPLFGNVLLHDFDLNLNSGGIVCLRYIDDFLILGHNEKEVREAFKKAQEILRKYGMCAYVPSKREGKAKEGLVSTGLEFLGCFINEGFVHPSKKSQENLKEKIRSLFDNSSNKLRDIKSIAWKPDFSLVETLKTVSNMLRGWGNQYSFCNANQLFGGIDRDVDRYIKKYIEKYFETFRRLKKEKDFNGLRKILGVWLLSESRSAPILPLKGGKKEPRINRKPFKGVWFNNQCDIEE